MLKPGSNNRQLLTAFLQILNVFLVCRKFFPWLDVIEDSQIFKSNCKPSMLERFNGISLRPVPIDSSPGL